MSTIVESSENSLVAIPYVSCIHNPVELQYIQWFEWAEKQEKKGKKQKQCPICKKWFYPCEYGNNKF